MNFTIKAKSVHFLHSTAAQLVTIHDANTEHRELGAEIENVLSPSASQ
jgi:hypothetical protein